MGRVVREYRKIEIARSMLDTAIKIYLDEGDRFSVLHLASAAEEVIAGLLKRRRSDLSTVYPQDRTAREKTMAAIVKILEARGVERTEKEVGTFLNAVRNGTKHHGDKDSETVVADAETEAWGALFRAIDNYGRYANTLSEMMIEFAHRTVGAPLISVPRGTAT
ncbi:hypothetical protein QZM22_29355 [Burkholderia oklahomensis]|uniref:hypothetical protein n=1 Tax=Burkholderia oklahomensis TaxID=342113 RepID=UPI00264BD25D|nr:hypothetical protein [Burkholderia oklahomensis]MDN7676480.1 hypothetical protein [Burkholderia oklahomensis]